MHSRLPDKPNADGSWMTREQWFSLPLALRQRWWVETDFDRRPPSPELRREVERVLASLETAQ